LEDRWKEVVIVLKCNTDKGYRGRLNEPVSPPICNAKKSKPLKTNTFQWFFVLGKCIKKHKKAGFELEDRWKECMV
jgi:hypothetical protein